MRIALTLTTACLCVLCPPAAALLVAGCGGLVVYQRETAALRRPSLPTITR